jgi:peptidyl-prolyl cis-trans isomerase SurA
VKGGTIESYMVTQIGSLDKVIKYYKKNTEEEFRSFFDILKRNFRQNAKVEEVEITPEEVRNFSNVAVQNNVVRLRFLM